MTYRTHAIAWRTCWGYRPLELVLKSSLEEKPLATFSPGLSYYHSFLLFFYLFCVLFLLQRIWWQNIWQGSGWGQLKIIRLLWFFPLKCADRALSAEMMRPRGNAGALDVKKKKKIWLKVNDLLSCTAAGLEKKSLRNRRREILIKTSPACTQWMHFNLNYTFLPLFSPKKIKLNQVIYILFIQTIQMQAINRAVLDEPQSCVWWRNHLNNRN